MLGSEFVEGVAVSKYDQYRVASTLCRLGPSPSLHACHTPLSPPYNQHDQPMSINASRAVEMSGSF
jgi:hypothetical protein